MPDHGDSNTHRNRSQDPPPNYPANRSGLTYGSPAEATTLDNGPDLVLVVATNGKEGYARRAGIEPYQPRDPQEALARRSATTDRMRDHGITSAVSASDGLRGTILGARD
jgi:hypothetical protein